MGLRENLHDILVEALGSDEVYFQPPSTVRMHYPCIVYSLLPGRTMYSNNMPYVIQKRYQVIVIDKDPDSEIPDRIGMLATSTQTRRYTADNLYHSVYEIYY